MRLLVASVSRRVISSASIHQPSDSIIERELHDEATTSYLSVRCIHEFFRDHYKAGFDFARQSLV
jgi:hypothetical protein